MKFYVVSRLDQLADVRNLIVTLNDEVGLQAIYDWTTHGRVGPERQRDVALAELRAIPETDVVFVLTPIGTGSYLEIGYAIAHGKPIWVINSPNIQTTPCSRCTGPVKDGIAMSADDARQRDLHGSFFFDHPLVTHFQSVHHFMAVVRATFGRAKIG